MPFNLSGGHWRITIYLLLPQYFCGNNWRLNAILQVTYFLMLKRRKFVVFWM